MLTVIYSEYKALFYAGGHGPMFDLPNNEEIAKLARAIYENGGVLSAVCHGTVGMYRLFIKYRKNSKIWDTSNNCHNCPKNRKV